jgi:hypothetical protein
MDARDAKGRRTANAGIKAQIDALNALAGDPVAQGELAVSYVTKSKNMELLRPALNVLQARLDPALRPLLHDKYHWCAAVPERNDSGGVVRAAIIRALQPIIHQDDLPILRQGLVSYQMVGMYEVTAELRVAALIALNDLDPDLAALFAARFLNDPRNSNSGEPALTAIRLLAAQQDVATLFGFAAWPNAGAQETAEALRSLVDLPASMVPFLIEQYHEREDEQILLGLFDLLLAHPARAQWHDTIEDFLRTTRLLDLYALIVTQIVASRDESLIRMLRELAAGERDRIRYELLQNALEHA